MSLTGVTSMVEARLEQVIRENLKLPSEENEEEYFNALDKITEEPSVLDAIFNVCSGKEASNYEKVQKSSVEISRLYCKSRITFDMAMLLVSMIDDYVGDHEDEGCLHLERDLEPVDDPKQLATLIKSYKSENVVHIGKDKDKNSYTWLFAKYKDKFDRQEDVWSALSNGLFLAMEEGYLSRREVDWRRLHTYFLHSIQYPDGSLRSGCFQDIYNLFDDVTLAVNAEAEAEAMANLKVKLDMILDKYDKEVQGGPEDHNGDGAVE